MDVTYAIVKVYVTERNDVIKRHSNVFIISEYTKADKYIYHINYKYLDKHLRNNVDPAASDDGLYCLPLVQQCLVCIEVLRPSQPNGALSFAVMLPNQFYRAGLVL